MDVTNNNFKEILPLVLEAIDSCDFIAIDTEFTGLRNGSEVTAYDTPAMYYNKLRSGSFNFLIIQTGLCIFKYDETQRKYTYKAFNFYVFPRTVGKNNNSINFLCQSSSVDFLSGVGFDFNKLFKEGIPFLNIADEESLQDEIKSKYEIYSQNDSTPKTRIPDELKFTIEENCSKINKYLEDEENEDELLLDGLNGFGRKLIYEVAYERFPNKNFCLSTRWTDSNPFIVVEKGKSKAQLQKENYEKEIKEIDDCVGFSKIIRHMSKSNKLIVGHNMLLDICHIVNRFYLPLPETYWEFKEMLHHVFPRLVDTKYMCSANPFKNLIPSSVLAHMVKRLKEPPFTFSESVPFTPEFGYVLDDNKAHEAGFDAYMTGLSFISLTSYLGKEKNIQFPTPLSTIDLKSFENKLFLMKLLDYTFINLSGKEPNHSRKNVFYLTFPKEWKTDKINKLFSPYGDIHVSYCSSTNAWITLLDPSKSSSVVKNLIEFSSNEGILPTKKNYSVITWNQYSNVLFTNNPSLKRPKTKNTDLTAKNELRISENDVDDPANSPDLNSSSIGNTKITNINKEITILSQCNEDAGVPLLKSEIDEAAPLSCSGNNAEPSAFETITNKRTRATESFSSKKLKQMKSEASNNKTDKSKEKPIKKRTKCDNSSNKSKANTLRKKSKIQIEGGFEEPSWD